MLQASHIFKTARTWAVVAIGGASTFSAVAQTPNAAPPVDHAQSYYHYSLGHMYADLASINGSPEYIRKAIENYKLAIKDDPNTPMLSEELSELYIQTGRLREAQADAEETLKTNPNDVNAHRMLGRIFTRQIGDQQEHKIDETMLKKSIEEYKKITELDPKDTDSWLMLGRLEKVATNSVEAQRAYKKALEIDPDNEDALTGLAMVYADLGDSTAAADLLKKLATKNPTPRSLQALAAAYEQMREFALAAETHTRASVHRRRPELAGCAAWDFSPPAFSTGPRPRCCRPDRRKPSPDRSAHPRYRDRFRAPSYRRSAPPPNSVATFSKPAQHQPRIGIFRIQFGDLFVLFDRLLEHRLVDAVLLAVADLARENSPQHPVRVHVVGIGFQGFLGIGLRLAQTAGLNIELGEFLAQHRRVGIVLDGQLVIFDGLPDVFRAAVDARQIRVHVAQGIMIIGGRVIHVAPVRRLGGRNCRNSPDGHHSPGPDCLKNA